MSVRGGHVHHAAVGERGDLLRALRQGARPRQLQLADVVPVHLVEGAVAPPVEGAPPHRPVGGVGVLEHLVGDRHEVARGLGLGGGRRAQGEGHDHGGGEQGRDGVARLQHLGTPLRKCGRRPVAWASARRRQPGRSAPGAERCCPARLRKRGRGRQERRYPISARAVGRPVSSNRLYQPCPDRAAGWLLYDRLCSRPRLRPAPADRRPRRRR